LSLFAPQKSWPRRRSWVESDRLLHPRNILSRTHGAHGFRGPAAVGRGHRAIDAIGIPGAVTRLPITPQRLKQLLAKR
jgi:hypothetical protein